MGVVAVQVNNISGEVIMVKCSSCGKQYKVAPDAAIPICHGEFMKEKI